MIQCRLELEGVFICRHIGTSALPLLYQFLHMKDILSSHHFIDVICVLTELQQRDSDQVFQELLKFKPNPISP